MSDINELIAELGNPNIQKRRAATNSLVAFKQVAVAPLIDILERADKEDVNQENLRWHAIEALGRIGDPKAIPVLLELTEDMSERIQSKAVGSLEKFVSDPQVAQRLEYLVRHSAQFPKSASFAGNFIGYNNLRSAAFWLDIIQDKDCIDSVVICAAQYLSKMDEAGIEEVFQATITRCAGNNPVVLSVFNSWMAFNPKPTFEDIAPFLRSDDVITRGHAARVLGILGDARAVELLQPMTSDNTKVYQVDYPAVFDTIATMSRQAIEQIQRANQRS
jgi:HEAT repeat protein